LGLLQHDLGNPYTVGVIGFSPGQPAVMGSIPLAEAFLYVLNVIYFHYIVLWLNGCTPGIPGCLDYIGFNGYNTGKTETLSVKKMHKKLGTMHILMCTFAAGAFIYELETCNSMAFYDLG